MKILHRSFVIDSNATISMIQTVIFDANSIIRLTRPASDGSAIIVDQLAISSAPWLITDGNGIGVFTLQRDIAPQLWVKRLWDLTGTQKNAPALGRSNLFLGADSAPIQTVCADGRLRNVGDLGYMLKKAVYFRDVNELSSGRVIGYPIGSAALNNEAKTRINLADPNVQRIFRYITVFDPGRYVGNLPTETRIKGRININTAPWFVIAQLPWVSSRLSTMGLPMNDPSLAKTIVAYRDKGKFETIDYNDRAIGTGLGAWVGDNFNYVLREEPGFASIGELTTIINSVTLSGYSPTGDSYSMWYYQTLGRWGDQIGYPDLTTKATGTSDQVRGDFEKRNLIFSRISDLVTVRSDVFTAYILVRLGPDGPQSRVMVIFDRSEAPARPVKIVAFQPVPDAR